jgi:endonuclease G, mitochondrial
MEPPASPGSPPADRAIGESVRRALDDLAANQTRAYYDAQADSAARDRFYGDVDLEAGPTELYASLSELLEATHRPRPSYRPVEHLYPWVDLHPDGTLHHIYSGTHADPEDVIRADAEIARERSARLQDRIARDATLGPRELESTFDELEHELPFNCEHVVPQSWFGKHEPMRGDLHHLFACEPRCNSFRGNTPYAELVATEEQVSDCGRSEPAGFEPTSGKGPVARATLYFLLRYPGLVGDEAREMQRAVVPTMVDWHAGHAVTDYERHRNAAISEVQGNRNPLIDFPELAGRIDFGLSFSAKPDAARRPYP